MFYPHPLAWNLPQYLNSHVSPCIQRWFERWQREFRDHPPVQKSPNLFFKCLNCICFSFRAKGTFSRISVRPLIKRVRRARKSLLIPRCIAEIVSRYFWIVANGGVHGEVRQGKKSNLIEAATMPAMEYESEYGIDVVNRFAGLSLEIDDPSELIQQAQQKEKALKTEKKQAKGGKGGQKGHEKAQPTPVKETIIEDIRKEGMILTYFAFFAFNTAHLQLIRYTCFRQTRFGLVLVDLVFLIELQSSDFLLPSYVLEPSKNISAETLN